MPRKLLISLICIVGTIVCGLFAWDTSYRAALDVLNEEANRKLVQIVDQFRGQLSAARILPTLLARNGEVVDSLENGSINERVVEYLEHARDLSGALEVRLLNSSGGQIFTTRDSRTEYNDRNSQYFSKAMQGALGVEFRYNETTGIRTLTFARSILSTTYQQIGVVVLDLEIEALETEFRARPENIVFLDQSDNVVFSNRARFVFSSYTPQPGISKSSQPATTSSLTDIVEQSFGENEPGFYTILESIFRIPAKGRHMVTKRNILPLELNALLLTDTKPALVQARKITSLAVVLFILGIVTAIALFQRRRYFIERIESEQALTKELDRRVELRSKELEHAQSELVQAEKLSALGKMSMGISHELSQPIASIQNFAVNAKRFLEGGRIDESNKNLSEIESQTERMSRIIRNLRSFSRKDSLPSEPVDICRVISEVAEMLEQRVNEESVILTLISSEPSIIVSGGEIRLQQILINLITNAMDALKYQKEKHIRINTQQLDQTVEISIRDNGPGLSEPSRVFEPFYTTKTGSHDDGLGLGLSIAYGFVESFGGSLRAVNCDGGGALFTLILPAIEINDN